MHSFIRINPVVFITTEIPTRYTVKNNINPYPANVENMVSS